MGNTGFSEQQKPHNQSHTSGVVPGFVVVEEVAESRTHGA